MARTHALACRLIADAACVTWQVWDDRSLHNVDFSTFCPMFSLKEINHLEAKFLELIDYDVSITSRSMSRSILPTHDGCPI